MPARLCRRNPGPCTPAPVPRTREQRSDRPSLLLRTCWRPRRSYLPVATADLRYTRAGPELTASTRTASALAHLSALLTQQASLALFARGLKLKTAALFPRRR